jgi:hypothetical protein
MSKEFKICRRRITVLSRITIFILLAAVTVTPSQAQESSGRPQTSLFFTPQEAHDAETLAQRISPPGRGDIRLGAVLYYGPEDWTLWLQGEKWTPGTSRDDLQVLEVTASFVRLSWKEEDGASPIEFSLKPNQSFQIATRKVIAGP